LAAFATMTLGHFARKKKQPHKGCFSDNSGIIAYSLAKKGFVSFAGGSRANLNVCRLKLIFLTPV
jgi:hypothetical protein